MALTQAMLDQMAAQALAALGTLTESVTYYAKSGPAASPTTFILSVCLGQYRKGDVDLETILPEDRPLYVPTSSVSFTPAPYDEFTQSGGQRWRVQRASGGAGMPLWVLQCRKVA